MNRDQKSAEFSETVSAPKPDDVFNAELGEEMAKRTDKLADRTIEIAIRVKQAREFLAWSTAHIRGCWLDWEKESSKAVQDINMLRMSFERETKTITASAKDVKEFFNDPQYIKAHATMREMIDMLSRFEELKKNGTMDAFSDFILKVTCR